MAAPPLVAEPLAEELVAALAVDDADAAEDADDVLLEELPHAARATDALTMNARVDGRAVRRLNLLTVTHILSSPTIKR